MAVGGSLVTGQYTVRQGEICGSSDWPADARRSGRHDFSHAWPASNQCYQMLALGNAFCSCVLARGDSRVAKVEMVEFGQPIEMHKPLKGGSIDSTSRRLAAPRGGFQGGWASTESTHDLQIRQRPLEFSRSGVGDLGSGDVEFRELGEPLYLNQAGVGDLRAAEPDEGEIGQSL